MQKIVMIPNSAPAHEHDCADCEYKGTGVVVVRGESPQLVDVYTCNNGADVVTRYSSREDHYGSMPIDILSNVHDPRGVTALAARAVGLL